MVCWDRNRAVGRCFPAAAQVIHSNSANPAAPAEPVCCFGCAKPTGGLGSLLGTGVGRDIGLRNPNDIYVGMLRSRTVADDLINQFNLIALYHAKFHEDARLLLASRSEIVAGKDGIIAVSVEDRDPQRA